MLKFAIKTPAIRAAPPQENRQFRGNPHDLPIIFGIISPQAVFAIQSGVGEGKSPELFLRGVAITKISTRIPLIETRPLFLHKRGSGSEFRPGRSHKNRAVRAILVYFLNKPERLEHFCGDSREYPVFQSRCKAKQRETH